ncbi:hypothetical protein [Paenibacillus sp. 7523-1]|uniref:hypothetical protein n=1 Tax=Paenibacillus sp. 7523-1 TaxID=2022550 RepID=UPI003F8E2891
MQLLSQEDMESEQLKIPVRDRITDIESHITNLQRMQTFLEALLMTSEKDIHNYIQSFRNHKEE